MNIVKFLNARYDEDEALINALLQGRHHLLENRWQHVEMDYRPAYSMLIGGPTPHRLICRRDHETNILAEHLAPELAAFLASQDPTRALAEIAAKRRLLEVALLLMITPAGVDIWEWNKQRPAGWMLSALAVPYADHPDYDPSWSLDG